MPSSVKQGQVCRGRPYGYADRGRDVSDYDPPSYGGVPATVTGPISIRESSLGHTVYVIEGVVVDPDSVEAV